MSASALHSCSGALLRIDTAPCRPGIGCDAYAHGCSMAVVQPVRSIYTKIQDRETSMVDGNDGETTSNDNAASPS
jgi:hypothetical protein